MAMGYWQLNSWESFDCDSHHKCRTFAALYGIGLWAEAKLQETVATCPSLRFVVIMRRESSSRRTLAWLERRRFLLQWILTLVSDLVFLLSPLTSYTPFSEPHEGHP